MPAATVGSSAVEVENQGQPQGQRESHVQDAPSQRQQRCRFVGTKNGCRAGSQCPFWHDSSVSKENQPSGITCEAKGIEKTNIVPPKATPRKRTQAVTEPVPASRVVTKPVSQASIDNPREFQIGQVRRRYFAKETKDKDGSTALDFSLVPSDPDFPFEMQALQCLLTVPLSYPESNGISQPSLKVKNQEFARGFAINIEKGFQSLVESRPDSTLLGLISALDRNLEDFLSKKQAETVKLIANTDRRHLASLPVRSVGETPLPLAKPQPAKAPKVARKQEFVYTKAQISDAKERRDTETRQVEARLGRLPQFKRSYDGIAYSIPIEPGRRSELPPPLQVLKTIQLFVPVLYPLQCCRIHLDGIFPEDALQTELAFERRAKEMSKLNLMGHINYLTQNMHLLSKVLLQPASKAPSVVDENEEFSTPPETIQQSSSQAKQGDDRSHVIVIPRPPEWDTNSSDSETDFDVDNTSEDSNFESDADNISHFANIHSTPQSERGTAITFPSVVLTNIELLELSVLNITVKCTRCKNLTDITSLTNNKPHSLPCPKCTTTLSATFHTTIVFPTQPRAGYLDLTACTLLNLLASTFIPTCSSCSTAYSSIPGLIAVRGDATTVVCRTCHTHLTLKIPETRFLKVTPEKAPSSAPGPRAKSDTLGITVGTELPDRGACKHYRKSFRWFRFSCCGKVYACDRCHDEVEKHVNERAERMVCGWCSREQRFRADECGICGRGVVGRAGGGKSGFWEGGKGTRDRVKMSRKEGRKYKRIGGEKGKEKT